MITIEKGKPYPGSIKEGVIVDLFTHGGNTLRIGMPQITRLEEQEYRTGKVRFGLIAQKKAILTLWKFGNEPWIDAPFDAPLARSAGLLELTSINPDSHLLIDLHLVDTQSGIVRGLRAFTLSARQTTAVCSAIQDQLSSGASDDALSKLLNIPTDTLAKNNEIT